MRQSHPPGLEFTETGRVLVASGAGGVVGNWTGGSDLAQGDVLAAATPTLFEAAVRLFAERP